MKRRYFPIIIAFFILGFGCLLCASYLLSQRAAWSYIISSINNSAWELYKPFGYSYIFFIIIELSCLRPSLTKFISSKLIGMFALCFVMLSVAMVLRFFTVNISVLCIVSAALGVAAAQYISYGLYFSEIRTEYFTVPLIVSLCAMIFLLLLLSFYPPHFGIFYDFIHGGFGKNI